MRFSLLHATRGRDALPWICIRDWWLPRTRGSVHEVEHIMAFDGDCEAERTRAKLFEARLAQADWPSWWKWKVVVGDVAKHPPTNYGAWNHAADVSTGDVLIQLSDDFEPDEDWDVRLAEQVDLHGGVKSPLVIGVGDPPGPRPGSYLGTGLNTFLVITRAYVQQRGYFLYPEYWTFGDYDETNTPIVDDCLVGAYHISFYQRWEGGDGNPAQDAVHRRENVVAMLDGLVPKVRDGERLNHRQLAMFSPIEYADEGRPYVRAQEYLAPPWMSDEEVARVWEKRRLRSIRNVPRGELRQAWFAGDRGKVVEMLKQRRDKYTSKRYCDGRFSFKLMDGFFKLCEG